MNALPAASGWTCPTHRKAVVKVSSRSGREYVGCPDCNLFERPGEPLDGVGAAAPGSALNKLADAVYADWMATAMSSHVVEQAAEQPAERAMPTTAPPVKKPERVTLRQDLARLAPYVLPALLFLYALVFLHGTDAGVVSIMAAVWGFEVQQRQRRSR
jgi:hypothetical protein